MTILTKKSQAKQETASFNKKKLKSFKKRISWEPGKLSLKGVEMKDLTLGFEV